MATCVQQVLPPLLDSKAEQLLLFDGATSEHRERMCGQWTPIKHVKNRHVKEVGQYAVDEYNKRSNDALEFETVICGEVKVVDCGIYYKLIIAAKDEMVKKNYEAVVFEKPWENQKALIYLKCWA